MVLEAARREGAYMTAASSSSVYGSVPDLPRTEALPTRPMSPYAASKLATESYVLAYGTSYGLPTLPFRFFNVYGPRQAAGHVYAAVIPVFIDAALKGQPLPLNGDGKQSRDFTFVDTVTWVLADAIHRQVTSDVPVNLAIGANVTLLDLVGELQGQLGRPLEIEHRPERVGDAPRSLIRFCCANSSPTFPRCRLLKGWHQHWRGSAFSPNPPNRHSGRNALGTRES